MRRPGRIISGRAVRVVNRGVWDDAMGEPIMWMYTYPWDTRIRGLRPSGIIRIPGVDTPGYARGAPPGLGGGEGCGGGGISPHRELVPDHGLSTTARPVCVIAMRHRGRQAERTADYQRGLHAGAGAEHSSAPTRTTDRPSILLTTPSRSSFRSSAARRSGAPGRCGARCARRVPSRSGCHPPCGRG